jgi:hypothetical protein
MVMMSHCMPIGWRGMMDGDPSHAPDELKIKESKPKSMPISGSSLLLQAGHLPALQAFLIVGGYTYRWRRKVQSRITPPLFP